MTEDQINIQCNENDIVHILMSDISQRFKFGQLTKLCEEKKYVLGPVVLYSSWLNSVLLSITGNKDYVTLSKNTHLYFSQDTMVLLINSRKYI